MPTVVIVLAENLRDSGRTAEAEALYKESSETLEKYRQYDRPSRLLPEGSPASTTHISAPVSEAECCTKKCTEAFARLPIWKSFEVHIRNLLYGVREALSVERIALFSLDSEKKLNFVSSIFFSQAERESKPFRIHLKRLSECILNERIETSLGKHEACLYMPLSVNKEHNYALLLHCTYLKEQISLRDQNCFKNVKKILETELRLAFRLQQGLEVIRKEDEKRVVLAAERLGEDDRLYYGLYMHKLLQKADKAARTEATMLLLGETGVGKEELARRIHANSGRVGPFVPVNPSSIPEHLFESELFGHEKGAFTGAHRQKIGLLELADRGTLFIDELGDIPLSAQVKLLRVLQDKRFRRVGGLGEIHSKFRLISATNQDLEKKVRENDFREDLYYRIAVVPLVIPPLRERPEDIKYLAEIFYKHYAQIYRRSLPPLQAEHLEFLCRQPWHGNVRELKSFMERAVILYDESSTNPLLYETPRENIETLLIPQAKDLEQGNTFSLDSLLFDSLPNMKELQRNYIRYVLTLTRGKVDGEDGAMKILGMKRSNLYSKIREYGLDKTSQLYGQGST